MDQLDSDIPFTRYVAQQLKDDFVLIDVGAAGGLAHGWQSFGTKLCGYGFDPDESEVNHLNSLASGIRYISGYVGLPPNHPFALQRRGQPRLSRNPWNRLAVERWLQIQRARDEGRPVPQNEPRLLPYGGEAVVDFDIEHTIINLPDFFRSEGVNRTDFIKVDVDGADFEVLQSLANYYERFGVLGVGVEVNFFGSAAPTDNTFHNIDRFLKSEGFELFDIRTRRYPVKDLPAPCAKPDIPYPASSAFGRCFQGDAFYARDICAPENAAFVEFIGHEGLAKLAALFALFGLPDCAAEIMLTYGDRLTDFLDIDSGLDLLARQAQPEATSPLLYRDYIAQFERESYEPGGLYRGPGGAPDKLRS
jgi:hypothetical protein